MQKKFSVWILGPHKLEFNKNSVNNIVKLAV